MILTAIVAALFFYFLAFYVLWEIFGTGGKLAREQDIKKRLFSPQNAIAYKEVALEKKSPLSHHSFLREFFGAYSLAHHTAILLTRAKIKMSVAAFFILSFLVGVIGFFVLCRYVSISFSLAGCMLLMLSPFAYLNFQNRRYLKRFEEFFPDAISTLSSSMKVGHGIETAVDVVAKTGVYPVNIEFEIFRDELQLGISVPQALKNYYARISLPEVKIMSMAMSLHQEFGGNLTEVLDNLEKMIRQRFVLRREIQVLSAQGRLSSYVLMTIPFALAGALYFLDHQNFTAFLSSEFGKLTLYVNAFVLVICFFWMQAIVNLKE